MKLTYLVPTPLSMALEAAPGGVAVAGWVADAVPPAGCPATRMSAGAGRWSQRYPQDQSGLWRGKQYYSDVIMGTMASHHQPHDCLLNHLLRLRSKKTSKLHVTGLYAGNSPVTGEFPAQMASNAEKVSIWWCHLERGRSWIIEAWIKFMGF